jgi:hypothetical protein
MTHSCRLLVTTLVGLASSAMLAACSGSNSTQPGDSGVHDTSVSDAASKDSPVSQDAPTSDVKSDSLPPTDGGPTGPITGLATEKWTWVPFPGSKCRDGSSTGIGVNYNPASDKVMIYLEGGGACFNFATCVLGANPASFSESDFESLATSSADYSLNAGMLDRTKAANPVQDWSYVYVPYCSGDVHAGNNPTATISSVTGEPGQGTDFAGYTNMQQYLSRVVPTFSKATQVLFAGMSAGGFGAAADYALAATAFGSTPVVMLDDSGPFMEDPYFTTCLASQVTSLWGLDKTVFAACGSSCSSPSNAFLSYASVIVNKYPNVTFGLADSFADGTISSFFGFGLDSCTSTNSLTPSQFTAGLMDIRSKLASAPNFGTFYFPGTDHTSTQSAVFYTRTAGGTPDGGVPDGGAEAGAPVLMTDWVAALIAGHAMTVGQP